MSNLKRTLYVIIVAVFAASNYQVYAQNDVIESVKNNQNVIEFISLNLPDSAAFKFVKGEAEKYSNIMIWLVNEDGKTEFAKYTKIETPNVRNRGDATFNDETEGRVYFKINPYAKIDPKAKNKPKGKNDPKPQPEFIAKKIKFELTSPPWTRYETYYDIENEKWEPLLPVRL